VLKFRPFGRYVAQLRRTDGNHLTPRHFLRKLVVEFYSQIL
jgi:hypothetical protein